MNKNEPKGIWLRVAILLVIALLIRLVSVFSGWIELYYSSGLYPPMAAVLRSLTSWLPFSAGDIFYAIVAIWLIVQLVKFIRVIIRRKFTGQSFLNGSGKLIIKVLWVYIIFNLFWGLNYDRLGISYQLHLHPSSYSTEELKKLTVGLINKVNAERRLMGDSNFIYPSYKEIFRQAEESYDSAEKKYSFLHYPVKSVKRSLYGILGNYAGFLGYYNPFSGESQVNVTVPPFTIPYTTCHEIAHQLGYGTEDEANFVGYLSATASPNHLFHYSAYFDLFAYANGELYIRDSMAARNNYKQLDTLVKRDFTTYRKFLRAHRNAVEPIIRMFYGEYLKANRQPQGIDTYDEVVAWMIAYEKKYGEL